MPRLKLPSDGPAVRVGVNNVLGEAEEVVDKLEVVGVARIGELSGRASAANATSAAAADRLSAGLDVVSVISSDPPPDVQAMA